MSRKGCLWLYSIERTRTRLLLRGFQHPKNAAFPSTADGAQVPATVTKLPWRHLDRGGQRVVHEGGLNARQNWPVAAPWDAPCSQTDLELCLCKPPDVGGSLNQDLWKSL